MLCVCVCVRPCSDFSTVSTKQDVRDRLQAAYSDINNIDAWVGGLAEDHVYVQIAQGVYL